MAFSNSGGGDWKYYKEITVKENSGKTLTDFQVLLELNPANFPANAKILKSKQFAKKAAPVAACALVVAMPSAGVGAVNVASASTDDGIGIPEDWYDETMDVIGGDIDIAGYMDFKALHQSILDFRSYINCDFI